MKDLIEALQIFAKYMDPNELNPTHCEHDILYICGGIDDETEISREDIRRLLELGFSCDSDMDGWYSFRFGSC